MITINFCGSEWGIIEVSTIVDDEVCDGKCHFNKELIELSQSLTHYRKGVALVHELLHVIYDYVGVEKDEKLVRQLEHHVYDLIKKFPEEYK